MRGKGIALTKCRKGVTATPTAQTGASRFIQPMLCQEFRKYWYSVADIPTRVSVGGGKRWHLIAKD